MSTSTSPSGAWPPPTGLTTKAVPQSHAVVNLSASAKISASAHIVFTILTQTPTYPSWNTFVPRVTIHSQPADISPDDDTLRLGTDFSFHVVMDERKPDSANMTRLAVTDLSTPEYPSSYLSPEFLDANPCFSPASASSRIYRIGWTSSPKAGLISYGLKAERFHEVIPLGEGECEVKTWECQGGPLAWAVKWMFGKVLERKFGEWCEGLKVESEKRCAEIKESGGM
ncbi:hypothetical protein K402DRAFT_397568 [Aulographum hederae CBS 113979]|uniref:Coenzyme Q-binding protein COQ10 START domain-containing protein n=1 Tax=Aulographum hederae CBS 113979 TaxID=1176131 RepID=A0A6G1GNV3_9PEZI|nr:hypothetical protein K402DRAFT_397568 [Aulographum hederae CBS 113979]